MSDLEEALAEITAIRSHIARSAEFRGYGPATVSATGALAVVAADAQAWWMMNPASHVALYIALWTATAVLSITVIGIETINRSRRVHSELANDMIRTAVEQFIPAGAAGVLLTGVLLRFAPEALWMLPGLWQIVFSLGVFASCRFLPRWSYLVGVWYLSGGLVCLALANGEHAFSPWAMGLPFGIGQVLAAAVLRGNFPESDGHF